MTINSESQNFNRILRRTLFLPIILILGLGLILSYVTGQFFSFDKCAERSFQVLVQARTCEKELLDMETGLRGYFLTKDNRFLEPYEDAASKQQESFNSLRRLTKDDEEQSQRVETIIGIKDAWISDTVRRLDSFNRNLPVSLDTYLSAKVNMDSMRQEFDDLTARERSNLAEQIAKVNVTKNIIGVGSLFLLILLALAISGHVWQQLTALERLHKEALVSVHEKNQDLIISQAELLKQKEWFRVTLSSIGDAVMVTDPTGKIVFINQEAERLSGWARDEALQVPLQDVFQIVNEETRAQVENPVEKVFREKKVVGLANHTVLLKKDKQSECAIEDSAAPIYDEKGNILGVVLVFHDASEMRQAQRTLQAHSQHLSTQVDERTAKLQKALAEMETFSYTVSHDLRSPLRAMQGYAEAVLEDFGDKINEEGRRYLQRIKSAAERLDRLIQDLLAYTRISREETELVSINLDTLVRDIITQYANLFEADAAIQIQGKLPIVLGRESAMVQVFSNLLGNAVKFVLAGKRPEIKIYAEDQHETVRIWIIDNGIGIAANNHDRIFKMFEQVNNSTLYEGTGVGLAIVRRAVENMRGKVGVESTQGEGSKFWVEFKKVIP